MTSRRAVRAITVAVAVSSALALAGCSGPQGRGEVHGSAAPTAKAIGTRVDEPCATLVPDTVFRAYDKTFSIDPSASANPPAGTPAATIEGQRGRVCTWRSTDGTESITLAVAHLPESALTNLKNALYKNSNSVPTYTVEGYFAMQGKTGRADAFPDPYWIDVESSMFTEPGTAQPVIDAARAALDG